MNFDVELVRALRRRLDRAQVWYCPVNNQLYVWSVLACFITFNHHPEEIGLIYIGDFD